MREDVKEFFLKICDDEMLTEQFNRIKSKEDIETIIKQLGYDFSPKELQDVVIKIENEHKLKNDSSKLKKAYE